MSRENKYNVSISMDPGLHTIATEHAKKVGVSLSRLIHEALVAVVGDNIDPEVRAAVEARIAEHPGRKALSVEERERREEQREKEKQDIRRRRLERRLAQMKHDSEKTVIGGKIEVE